ncbi:7-cyano-7-deazaguanine synthase, partial [bacterium]|nr:7-cyano-7-deazaguanine synthase [bacterium]
MLKKKARALVLFSGGLDSMIAVKLLQVQNIEVEAICFVSNFFNSKKAEEGAKNLKIKLHIVNISKEMLKLVKNPPNGHGKYYNPCIDCHGLMVRKAGKFIEKNKKFDFLASGEVLGQRPFSQNKKSLKKVIDISGYEILRPLSAMLLLETEIEKKGLVKREELANISGRNRSVQF